MMKEGYAGADHIRFMTSNSFGWEVMRPGSVGNENWQEMKRVLIDDKLNLRLPEWMERNNPFAYQDSMAVMLEAIRKDYWQADAETKQQIAQAYAQSVARHGISGHITSGGNKPLDGMVREQLGNLQSPDARQLLAGYAQRIDEQSQLTAAEVAQTATAPGTAPGPAANAGSTPSTPTTGALQGSPVMGAAAQPVPAPANPTPATIVEGQKLQPSAKPEAQGTSVPQPTSWLASSWMTWSISAAVLSLLTAGFALRRGTP